MALRIKSHWHDDGAERSLEEIAGAIAYIIWRVAKDKAINLHGKDFVYADDRQRMDVILEYVIFQLQVVDRLANIRLGFDDEQRKEIILATTKKLAAHVHGNSFDLFGEGDHIGPFVSRLNERSTEYSEFNYTEDGPSYPLLRHFGFSVQQVMGQEGENRWVIDQVMDQDGPDVVKQITRAIDNLFE
ncbi:MAG: hypothetical protein PVG66_05335 [Chromatiales bacterium]|jgi:hypothetical protein